MPLTGYEDTDIYDALEDRSFFITDIRNYVDYHALETMGYTEDHDLDMKVDFTLQKQAFRLSDYKLEDFKKKYSELFSDFHFQYLVIKINKAMKLIDMIESFRFQKGFSRDINYGNSPFSYTLQDHLDHNVRAAAYKELYRYINDLLKDCPEDFRSRLLLDCPLPEYYEISVFLEDIGYESEDDVYYESIEP